MTVQQVAALVCNAAMAAILIYFFTKKPKDDK